MKKAHLLIVALVMAMTMLVTACGQQAAAPAKSENESKDTFTVGYTNMSDSDYWTKYMMDRISVDAEEQLGATVLKMGANFDASTQISQVENFIAKKVDAIVICAVDSDAVVPAVKAANEAGIPVIGFFIYMNGGKYYTVTADNYAAGQAQAELLAKTLPQNGTICYLKGTSGLKHAEERASGFLDNIAKLRPDAKILANQDGAFMRDKGQSITETWLQANPKIDAIIAGNDQMALGAVEALKGANKKAIVMGMDGTEDALAAVKAGTMLLTLGQKNDEEVAATVEQLKLIKEGGESEIKDAILGWNSITTENVDQYIGKN